MPDCPVCGRRLEKIHRRTIDRFISVFAPVNRFQCQAAGCHWEGNVRSRSKGSQTSKRKMKVFWWVLALFVAMIIGKIIVR